MKLQPGIFPSPGLWGKNTMPYASTMVLYFTGILRPLLVYRLPREDRRDGPPAMGVPAAALHAKRGSGWGPRACGSFGRGGGRRGPGLLLGGHRGCRLLGGRRLIARLH